MRVGSLCSGYEGIGLGLAEVFDVEHAWFADPDPGAAAVLAHHWPAVANLGDLTVVDWSTVGPVDMLTAGYPCQPFSLAGKRKGADDERHLWPHIAAAVGALRPRWVLLENVAGHVSMGLGDVLGDLAALRYDAVWCVVRADEAGAPHRRERLFVLASDPDGVGVDRPGLHRSGQRRRPEPSHGGHSAADAAGLGRGEGRAQSAGRGGGSPVVLSRAPSADAYRERREGSDGSRATRAARVAREAPGRSAPDPDRVPVREQPATFPGRGSSPLAGLAGSDAPTDADGHGQQGIRRVVNLQRDPDRRRRPDVAWGPYEPAIRRWERVLGRPAPGPTEPGRTGKPRLSPAFVEWLMGLPEGHVTAVPGLSRGAQLKALGNGVVPQQAALAVRVLTDLAGRWAA